MRPSFEPPRSAPRHTFRWLVALLAIVGFALGAWFTYRVTTFTSSVFGGSERPAVLAAVEVPVDVEEAPEPTAIVPLPTATPPLGTATPLPPEPTATPRPSPTPTPPSPTSVLGKLQAGQRVSFVLIGYGGAGHDGPYLTDSLVVVSYDPKSSQVALFNLPRDLWVQSVGANGRSAGSFRRINEVFGLGLGGAALGGKTPTVEEHDRAAWGTAAVAQQVLGLPIDGWLSADFEAVRQVVDGLGGVTVTVETAFDDYEYPRNDNASIDPSVMHLHFDSGTQQMTGERALQYARSRHAVQDGTDFGRARRQQRLVLALKDEALKPATLPKVFTLMEAVQGHVRTSLSLEEARDLALYGRDHNAAIQSVPSVMDTKLLTGIVTDGGASVLVPRAGTGNYTAIQQFVRTALKPVSDGPTRKA